MSRDSDQAKRARRRREQKRQERAAKSKAPTPRPSSNPPRARISVTLVEFAAPLLERLSKEETTPLRWKEELSLAVVVWNGVVLGEATETIVAKASAETGRSDVADMVRSLAERKRSLFAHDERCIVGFDTYERGGRVQVAAAGMGIGE